MPEQSELLSDEEAREYILKRLALLDDFVEEINSFTLNEGSLLHGDDLAAGIERPSFITISNILVAIDSLKTVRHMVETNYIPTFSLFTVLRSGLEALGIAMWIIGPGVRNERLQRCLQTAHESRKDIYSTVAKLKDEKLPDISEDANIQAIRSQAAQRKGLRKESIPSIPGLTARMKAAGKYFDKKEYPLVGLWSLMSGVAHSQRDIMIQIMEKMHPLDRDESSFQVTLQTNMTLLFGLTAAVDFYMDAVWKRLNELNDRKY